jgi:hypothetical protein
VGEGVSCGGGHGAGVVGQAWVGSGGGDPVEQVRLPASHEISAAESVGGVIDRSSREMSTTTGIGPSRSTSGGRREGRAIIGHRLGCLQPRGT